MRFFLLLSFFFFIIIFKLIYYRPNTKNILEFFFGIKNQENNKHEYKIPWIVDSLLATTVSPLPGWNRRLQQANIFIGVRCAAAFLHGASKLLSLPPLSGADTDASSLMCSEEANKISRGFSDRNGGCFSRASLVVFVHGLFAQRSSAPEPELVAQMSLELLLKGLGGVAVGFRAISNLSRFVDEDAAGSNTDSRNKMGSQVGFDEGMEITLVDALQDLVCSWQTGVNALGRFLVFSSTHPTISSRSGKGGIKDNDEDGDGRNGGGGGNDDEECGRLQYTFDPDDSGQHPVLLDNTPDMAHVAERICAYHAQIWESFWTDSSLGLQRGRERELYLEAYWWLLHRLSAFKLQPLAITVSAAKVDEVGEGSVHGTWLERTPAEPSSNWHILFSRVFAGEILDGNNVKLRVHHLSSSIPVPNLSQNSAPDSGPEMMWFALLPSLLHARILQDVRLKSIEFTSMAPLTSTFSRVDNAYDSSMASSSCSSSSSSSSLLTKRNVFAALPSAEEFQNLNILCHAISRCENGIIEENLLPPLITWLSDAILFGVRTNRDFTRYVARLDVRYQQQQLQQKNNRKSMKGSTPSLRPGRILARSTMNDDRSASALMFTMWQAVVQIISSLIEPSPSEEKEKSQVRLMYYFFSIIFIFFNYCFLRFVQF